MLVGRSSELRRTEISLNYFDISNEPVTDARHGLDVLAFLGTLTKDFSEPRNSLIEITFFNKRISPYLTNQSLLLNQSSGALD